MPAAFFIALEKPIRGLNSNMRFPALTAVSHKLESLAEKKGLQSHMHFFDSPEESDAILEEMEIESDEPSSYTWYAAADGLAMVRALRDEVKKPASRIASAAQVIAEMNDIEKILDAANHNRVGWCLTVDVNWKG
jgi:hypothetical protein